MNPEIIQKIPASRISPYANQVPFHPETYKPQGTEGMNYEVREIFHYEYNALLTRTETEIEAFKLMQDRIEFLKEYRVNSIKEIFIKDLNKDIIIHKIDLSK